MADLIDSSTAAAILGVSPSRVRQLDDVLAPIRIGRVRAYKRVAIERYAANRDARRSAR